jgi:hydrogenase nickel incorporation protein HypA/HybF
MHEMSITQSVVEICEQNAAGRRVLAVTLEIGALSGVVPEAVEFCFEACVRGTLLESAQLHIERIPATAYCQACQLLVPIAAYFDPCPSCGGYGLEPRTGEELRVRELEVD